MANFKKGFKKYGRYTWELFKGSLPSAFMFFCAGTILMMLTMKDDLTWNNSKLIWTIVCIVGGCLYTALISYATGGNQYEMLVSGNVKRMSAADFEGGYKISSHKESKEYRIWKGFAVGAFIGLYAIVVGIIFGCNQTKITEGLSGGALGVTVLICFLVSGWSILPFYYLNLSGVYVSYFLSCLFAIFPILVSGGFYIWGAYARRNKAIRKQILEDKAREAEEKREKKINYGGLPGTKPKKRK